MNLTELIRKYVDHRLGELRVAFPAQVMTYDQATQSANVLPLLLNRIVAEGGDVIEPLPVLPTIPVVFPRGGGYFMSFPLLPGDTGMVVVCDRSLDNWRQLGGVQDPLDGREHPLSGAAFYPGLHDNLTPITPAVSAAGMAIGSETGKQIHVSAADIALGAPTATDFVTLATLVSTELNKLVTAFNAHMHPTAGTGAPSPPTPVPGMIPLTPPTPASVASTIVRSE